MLELTSLIPQLLQGGLANLASYLAAHVLICLLPAFYIAGATAAMIPKQTVTRFLGRGTPMLLSYPAAALAGSAANILALGAMFAAQAERGLGRAALAFMLIWIAMLLAGTLAR